MTGTRNVGTLVVNLTMLALLWTATALAARPSTIAYEGWLSDSTGTKLHGVYDILFSIYGQPESGQALWQERHYAANSREVEIDSGWYLVELGKFNPIPDSLVCQTGRWLGVRVGSDPEQTPRVALIPGARAYRSTSRLSSERSEKRQVKCGWSERGGPDCRSFTLVEWSLMVVSASKRPPRLKAIASMGYGFIKNVTRNSGLGASIYLATGKDWRIGPRLRYRYWLHDFVAIDLAAGVTINLGESHYRLDNGEQMNKRELGFASAVRVNFLDYLTLGLEHDVYKLAQTTDQGEDNTQRALYLTGTAGSEPGFGMIALSAVVVLASILSWAD